MTFLCDFDLCGSCIAAGVGSETVGAFQMPAVPALDFSALRILSARSEQRCRELILDSFVACVVALSARRFQLSCFCPGPSFVGVGIFCFQESPALAVDGLVFRLARTAAANGQEVACFKQCPAAFNTVSSSGAFPITTVACAIFTHCS